MSKRDREWKKKGAKNSHKDNERNIGGFGIFLIILLFIVIYSIIKNLIGNEVYLTFGGFLELLQTAPTIDMSATKILFAIPSIDADWDAFNFLRNFINEYLIEPTNALGTMLVYVGEIGRNVAKFCSWLIQVLF